MVLSNFYLSRTDDDGSVLGLSLLSNRRAAAAGIAPSDASGYFLYRATPCDPDSVEILARVDSDEAALRLKGLLGLD